jgi:exopolyphosphatase/pppGpp-phosphohydrolase
MEKTSMNERSAIVELGTRGIRLLVVEINNGNIQRVVKSTGDLSNLGKEADDHGNLSEASIRRVTEITRRYKDISAEFAAKNIFIIATEVVRRAPNQDELIQSLANIAPLHILTPEEEAICIFIAAVSPFRASIVDNQPILVIDQGGGSTELVLGHLQDDSHIITGMALAPMGTTLLTRLFFEQEYLSDGFDAVQNYVRKTVAGFPNLANSTDKLPNFAIAHGSAIMIFAQNAYRRKYGHKLKLRELHGKTVGTGNLKSNLEKSIPSLQGLRQSDFGDQLTSESELVTLITGIVTYNEVAQKYGIEEFVLNREGPRYGALLWKTGAKYQVASPEIESPLLDTDQ